MLMSAPSFSSFPDLDPGPSRRTASPLARNDATSERPQDAHLKNKQDKTEGRNHKRDKGKKPKREHSRVLQAEDLSRHKDVWGTDSILYDEKLKSEDDRRRLERAAGDYDEWISRPLFYADRKGDPLNVTYGSLHSGDVPKYHLVDQGRHVLGLGGAWVVFRRAGKGVEVAMGGRSKQPALTDSGSKALLGLPSRRFNASRANYEYEEVDGFLRLPSRAARQTEAYRSITYHKDEADSGSGSSSSEAEEESDNEGGSPVLTSHQLALKAIEETLVTDPSSVRAWLSLLALSLSVVPLNSKNAAKTRSEITLSILTRARAHTSNVASRILWLKYLRAGEEVWHESKLRTEWEDALKMGGIEIWMEWMEWRIRKPSQGIDGVVADATRALKALGDSEDSEVDKLRVVWRVAVAFQEAGFHERAIAVFQAQAELTFEVPQSLYGLPVEMQLESLEEFWDSEVPRVGEPSAKGWSAWVSSGNPEASLYSGDVPVAVASASTDPFIRWYEDEVLADCTSRIPSRSTDKISASDPYATVLFADIKTLLLPLTTQRAKNVFRFIWLSILGLHIPGFVESLAEGVWDDRWSYTHLVTPSRLSSIFPDESATRSLPADSHAGALIGREKEYSSAFGPVKDWKWGVFDPLDWIGKDQWRMWTVKDVHGIDEDFIRAVFKQLRCGSEDQDWDTYALAFEAAINMKNALRLSRSFLSIARESLPHWAAHARLERLRGRFEDARKVYQTVLITTRRPPTQAFVGQLWWDWAEMEWLNSDPDVALRLVMRSGNVDGSGGVMVLRAKRNLEDIINASHSRSKDREGWVKLRALIELLTSLSPHAVLSIFDDHSQRGPGESACERESSMVASLVMLYNHSMILRAPTSPAVLRDRLQVAIETYPSNTIILGMFLEAEKGHGIWGRVRGQLGQSAASSAMEKTVARRVAEVWVAGWEKGRWKGEIERTRSGLTATVESERTRNSVSIWRVALEFEIRAGQVQRAKNLLYRAVSECPLSKGLYLLAFGPLRSAFTPHELNNFVDVMAERGLRMRRGLDEYVHIAEITDDLELANDSENSQGSEDEIEQEARERLRLMPY